MSINSAYYANKAHGYKSEVKDWISQICHELSQPANESKLKDLREHFDPLKHMYTVNICYTTPKFFASAGSIGIHSMDVGNVTKIFLDVLFTPAFYGNDLRKCYNLNIDDKFITTLITSKRPGKEYSIDFSVKIKNLPTKT